VAEENSAFHPQVQRLNLDSNSPIGGMYDSWSKNLAV